MIKYLPIIFISLTLVACQSETSSDQPSSDNSMNQQMPGNMQPQTDIEVSDEELDQFLEVSMMAREVQMGYQQEMMTAIEDEELALEIYNQIAQAVQMGQSPDEIDVSTENMEKYERANVVIEEIGTEMQEEIADSIEAAGMDMERFQALNQAIQQDPALQQRIQQKMRESGMMPQPPSQQQNR